MVRRFRRKLIHATSWFGDFDARWIHTMFCFAKISTQIWIHATSKCRDFNASLAEVLSSNRITCCKADVSGAEISTEVRPLQRSCSDIQPKLFLYNIRVSEVTCNKCSLHNSIAQIGESLKPLFTRMEFGYGDVCRRKVLPALLITNMLTVIVTFLFFLSVHSKTLLHCFVLITSSRARNACCQSETWTYGLCPVKTNRNARPVWASAYFLRKHASRLRAEQKLLQRRLP